MIILNNKKSRLAEALVAIGRGADKFYSCRPKISETTNRISRAERKSISLFIAVSLGGSG
jgi:hypothetical protein